MENAVEVCLYAADGAGELGQTELPALMDRPVSLGASNEPVGKIAKWRCGAGAVTRRLLRWKQGDDRSTTASLSAREKILGPRVHFFPSLDQAVSRLDARAAQRVGETSGRERL